ncbi:hypothetical protein EU805_05000 [Salipiger sp. IMCC34102]|uniref:hypothetical protein n=1 Tax=Salipiger sp. IMCC34102 TaxID=2510647 RepID=UPI00101C8D80|nr:hypothetical protein [Salipiger sp. IMCC34102]RYH03093.1 hypothetical protein EU805_05000 [Salipiger sp. IMCC34102]
MTLTEIETEIGAHLARLNLDPGQATLDRRPRGDGTPHVEGEGPIYDLVVDADGTEQSREAVDGHELVYLILRRRTRLIAQAEEKRTRQVFSPAWLGPVGQAMPKGLWALFGAHDYSRGTWIDAHVRLMDHLRGDWGARVQSEHDRTLRRYPLTPTERGFTRRLDLSAYGAGS